MGKGTKAHNTSPINHIQVYCSWGEWHKTHKKWFTVGMFEKSWRSDRSGARVLVWESATSPRSKRVKSPSKTFRHHDTGEDVLWLHDIVLTYAEHISDGNDFLHLRTTYEEAMLWRIDYWLDVDYGAPEGEKYAGIDEYYDLDFDGLLEAYMHMEQAHKTGNISEDLFDIVYKRLISWADGDVAKIAAKGFELPMTRTIGLNGAVEIWGAPEMPNGSIFSAPERVQGFRLECPCGKSVQFPVETVNTVCKHIAGQGKRRVHIDEFATIAEQVTATRETTEQ